MKIPFLFISSALRLLLLVLFLAVFPGAAWSQVTPTQVAPSGTTGGNPTVTWTGEGEWFNIYLASGTSASPGAPMIVDQYGVGVWLEMPMSNQLAIEGSVLINGANLPPGNYVWYIRSYGAGVTSAWSGGMNFHVASGRPAGNVFPVPGMRWIEPGTFVMGSHPSEAGRLSNESQHTVTLTKGFYMGSHEVTQAEYVAVIGSNPSNFQTPVDTNRPVETVSWTQAEAYCTALTDAERTAERIPAGWEYRLPTEAEWEYCCRAGAGTTRFSYDDDVAATALGDYAWYSSNSSSTTHPVGQKRGNAWGLHDMHGNVFEWCQDWWDGGSDYPAGSVTDPQGQATGSSRVLRGGSWIISADSTRCANRRVSSPGNTFNFVGFRVVLAPVQ